MNDSERKVFEFFHKYCRRMEINSNVEQHSYALHVIDIDVELEANFHIYQFNRFVNDIKFLIDCHDQMKEEAILRERSPAVQKAYEEYQILLKLVK